MTLSRITAYVVRAPAVVFSTVFFGTASVLGSLFDGTGNLQHRIARVWAKTVLAAGGARVEVTGLEKLDPHAPYVLVANHASYMDTPLVMGTIPLQFRFFAKAELFAIPFLGTHLNRAGHLPVVRDDPRASLKTMGEGARLMRDRKVSLLLFPEGGRSAQGLREFKEGAAYIAIRAGVPIVPLGLTGTRELLPMHSIVLNPGALKLQVGDPIPTAGLQPHHRGAVTQALFQQIAAMTGQQVPDHEPSQPVA